ncbi:MAG: hypothetical protein EZS28_045310, partial [Streblomastix strix]
MLGQRFSISVLITSYCSKALVVLGESVSMGGRLRKLKYE